MLGFSVIRRRWGVAALLALGLLAGSVSSASAARAQAGAHRDHAASAAFGLIDAPPKPGKAEWGSNLQWNAEPLLGNLEGDAEFWDLFYQAAAGIGPAAPFDGTLTGVYVKGRAVSGDMPGPEGSQPFRVGIEQPLPDGRLQVVSTSNPAFQLPATTGTYYYWIGPPSTGFQMPIKKGQIVSFDTRGGTWAVFGAAPGTASASTVGKGQEQNAGVIWTGTPHPGIELLMRMVEQPKIPTDKLDAASGPINKAITLEQQAGGATPRAAKSKLKSAIGELRTSETLVHQALAGEIAEISLNTEKRLEHYLRVAVKEDKSAASSKTQTARKTHLRLAFDAERTTLGDIRTARSLARHMF
jgi:hypothetical protein